MSIPHGPTDPMPRGTRVHFASRPGDDTFFDKVFFLGATVMREYVTHVDVKCDDGIWQHVRKDQCLSGEPPNVQRS
jgi:hypothetical protein